MNTYFVLCCCAFNDVSCGHAIILCVFSAVVARVVACELATCDCSFVLWFSFDV